MKLKISKKFRDTLKSIDDPIAYWLSNLKEYPDECIKKISYINISEEDTTKISYIDELRFKKMSNISMDTALKLPLSPSYFSNINLNLDAIPEDFENYFLEASKESGHTIIVRLFNLIDNPLNPNNRYKSSIGKVVNTLAPKLFTSSQIEVLTNKWNSFMCDTVFRIATGDDILKAYQNSEVSYLDTCMAGKHPKIFDIYTKNKNVSIMTAFNCGEYCGRALLWEGECGRVLMDRIYSSDVIYHSFMEESKKRNFLNRPSRSYEDKNIYDRHGNKVLDFKVKLDYVPKIFFPYLDTMTYLSEDNYLYNNSDEVQSILTKTLRSPAGVYSNKWLKYSEYADEKTSNTEFYDGQAVYVEDLDIWTKASNVMLVDGKNILRESAKTETYLEYTAPRFYTQDNTIIYNGVRFNPYIIQQDF